MVRLQNVRTAASAKGVGTACIMVISLPKGDSVKVIGAAPASKHWVLQCCKHERLRTYHVSDSWRLFGVTGFAEVAEDQAEYTDGPGHRCASWACSSHALKVGTLQEEMRRLCLCVTSGCV